MTKPLPETPDFEPLSRTQVLIAMAVTAVVLLIIAKTSQYFGSIAMLPLHWETTHLILGVGIGIGITAASSVLYRVWDAYQRSAEIYLDMVLKPLLLPDLIWLGLLPGLSEELLFRGVMLPAIGLNWVGIALSSLLFGVLHMSSPQQWAYVVWATIVGGLLGFCAVETGNLLVPIAAHITTNLLSSYLWKLGNLEKISR